MAREEIAAQTVDQFEFELVAILPNSACKMLGGKCDKCHNEVTGYANGNNVIFLDISTLDYIRQADLVSVKNIRTGKTEKATVLSIKIKPGRERKELFMNQKLATALNAQLEDKLRLDKI